jgi:UPF0042 nucleotide-binding protein
MGYFCADNLLPALFPRFLEIMQESYSDLPKMAVVVDIRGGELFPYIEEALSELKKIVDYQVVFLEASDAVLVSRFKETRRKHPLGHDKKTILQSIIEERHLLEEFKGHADMVIDTSNLTHRQLAAQIEEMFGDNMDERMAISVTSFGFKYGAPIDADLIIDVRFLPNPYYIPNMRYQTGRNKEVRDFVLQNDTTKEFIRRYIALLRFLLPHYIKEGKKHLSIAIGCTGGRHRSVAICEVIYKGLQMNGYNISYGHRDIGKADFKVQEELK